MKGLQPGGVLREAFVLGDAEKAGQRLAVGADGVGRLAFDLAAEEVEVNEGG